MRSLLSMILLAGLLLTSCNREPTPADIVAANEEAWTRLEGRIAKIRTTIDVMPDVRAGDVIDVGELPPPLFDAPPALPGNALTIPFEGLEDLTTVVEEPLRLARRDALHHLASYQARGVDLDGHALLPVDTLESWYAHVTQAQYLLVVRIDRYETPSWIMDTLIPGHVEGIAWLFDLQAGKPLGGYLIKVESTPPTGKRPSDRAMLAALHREAILAIRAGIETIDGARPPFGDLLQ